MNVIMFCAGLNPELRPFTDYKPKCLLPINNKSILFHNLDWLERQNFKNYEKKKVLEFGCQLHLGWKQLVFNLIFF